jgi:HPt (histidine-containing phosphotransfer) domain-containing protein
MYYNLIIRLGVDFMDISNEKHIERNIVFNKAEFEAYYSDRMLQKEILLAFLNEKENDTKAIDNAFRSKKVDSILETIHYMKGSFLYMKTTKILELSIKILKLCDVQKLEEILLLEDKFKQYYQELVIEIEKHIISYA